MAIWLLFEMNNKNMTLGQLNWIYCRSIAHLEYRISISISNISLRYFFFCPSRTVIFENKEKIKSEIVFRRAGHSNSQSATIAINQQQIKGGIMNDIFGNVRNNIKHNLTSTVTIIYTRDKWQSEREERMRKKTTQTLNKHPTISDEIYNRKE